jgi:hypothetical protein
MLALMMMRGEEREVDCFAHGGVAGMIGMEIIPRQLGELRWPSVLAMSGEWSMR